MPQGLQIWDASGNLVVDVSNSLGRVLGVTTISGTSGGTITDSRFNDGTPFWVVLPGNSSSAPSLGSYDTPIFSGAAGPGGGNSISYSVGYATTGVNYTVVYGIF